MKKLLCIMVVCVGCASASPPAAPPGGDGWCAIVDAPNGCPAAAPTAYKLCTDGQGAAPLPAACGTPGPIAAVPTDVHGWVCCP